jgi:Helicase HerA, central domain
MDLHKGAYLVRRRLIVATPAVIIFVCLGLVGVEDLGNPPWLSVGLGMALSAVFLEPYFAGPRSALVNGAAAALAILSMSRGDINALWWVALAAMFCIAGLGLTASVTHSGPLNRISKAISSRLGRASVVGGSVLLLCVLISASDERNDYQWLFLGSVILVAAISTDWMRLLSTSRQPTGAGIAVAAIGPRMLLVADTPSEYSAGAAVTISHLSQEIPATIVARLPHPEGTRYQLALTIDCADLCPQLPAEVNIAPSGAADHLIGAVGAGSTQHVLEFEPLSDLQVGAPVSVRRGENVVLYQVVHSRLKETSWGGTRAVMTHAQARLVGCPEEKELRGGANLPVPHEPIYDATMLSESLPEGYHRVGVLKETGVEIGLRLDSGRQGHIAVLGMSGMGKTVAATRICEAAGGSNVVVALDTTGEYQSRLSFPSWHQGDFDTLGHFAHEPAGHQPPLATAFIKECMDAGSNQYRNNEEPTPRVVLLEEAHNFIPEFPLALREHQKPIGESTRYIMQARKFGITFLVVSQRTAVVSKTALSQCENYIILKTLDKTSLEYFESVVGPEVRSAIPTLARYEAVCVGPAFNADEPVIVKLSDERIGTQATVAP